MKEAVLYKKLEANEVSCFLCSHRCSNISPGSRGLCGVRKNIDGVLYTLVYGNVVAGNVDCIEKKPLYHFYPGSKSFSIATVGCNFKCDFCQNWRISQVPEEDIENVGYNLSPGRIVEKAKSTGCKSIAYTYTEPTIFFEYAFDTAKLAEKKGLANVFVTNGYMTPEAIKMINPYLDAANIDLKSFRDDFYVKVCKGHLEPVLESIKLMKKSGIWVEVTTLVIPEENDSEDELKDIAQFIASVGKDIPWHISKFHPDYKYNNHGATPMKTLRKAEEIGRRAGLKHIYIGNAGEGLDTKCHNCQHTLIKRQYFSIEENLMKRNKCPFCNAEIGGVFE